MAAAIGLRDDFDAGALRTGRSKDGPQARRLLALAAIYDGGSRSEAARIGGVTLQSVRDWVFRFNAHGPAGLIDSKAPGQRPRLDTPSISPSRRLSRAGPIPAVHGVVRWRLIDLVQWILRRVRRLGRREDVGPGTARWDIASSRRVRAIMPRTRSPWRLLKKTSRPPGRDRREKASIRARDRALVRRRGPHRPEEQDHPPLGQARNPAQRAARSAHRIGLYLRRDLSEKGQGRRPRPALLQYRGDDACIWPKSPRQVAPGAHAVLIVDQAGWHLRRQDSSRPTSPSCHCRRNARN